MSIEGHLRIGLSTDSGRVDLVSIDSSRPLHASRVFHGRSIEEALKMLPRLYAICGTAQACAGVRACEQALGVRAAPHIEGLRDCLVRMETVREHLWRIMLDWPAFLGEMPEKNGMTGMLALQRDYRQALTGGHDPFLPSRALPEPIMPHGLVQKISLTLEQAVFGMSPARWLNISGTLEKWTASGVTMAARLLDLMIQAGWSGTGECEMDALPFMERGRLLPLLQDDDFIKRPQWLGNCCETTCLTRVDSPLLKQLRNRYGNGLLTRLAARLTEIAQLSGNLLPNTTDEDGETPVSAQNPGIGQVMAARGQLLHCVRLEGERIADYRILAPTEWNFHPRGVVAKCLAAVYGDAEQMEQQARLLINAIDPCVGYELTIV
ncbi:MAG: Ni,Fe-hydrogenase I large subunit [Gammaproteobacteria bacterium]|nr:Ni,Fe-hydrogenase I large subunit [Gammaproteobacteria bacterium]